MVNEVKVKIKSWIKNIDVTLKVWRRKVRKEKGLLETSTGISRVLRNAGYPERAINQRGKRSCSF